TATGGTGTFYIEASGPNYEINLLGKMIFERCNSDEYGGGLMIQCSSAGQITINEMSFTNCTSAMYGGGFFSKFDSGTQMTISGKVTYDKCQCTGRQGSSQSFGGGQYLEAGEDCKINVTGELEYKECEAHQGGGLYIDIRSKAIVEIKKATFTDSKSRLDGGGLFLYVWLEAQFTVYGTTSFKNCNSSLRGGGIYLNVDNGTVNFNPTEQILIEDCNCIQNGSGICCSITNKGQLYINNIKFRNCISQYFGGGIYTNINSEGQLMLDKSCEFYKCQSQVNGGGIHANISSEGQLTLVDQCEFNQCETGYDGSGIWANLVSGGHMTMSGSFSFIDCIGTSTSAYGLGGGLYAYTNNENCSLIFQGSMTFDGCQSVSGGGGAYLRVSNNSILIMSGSCSFTDCSSGGHGGGLSITTLGKGYDINLQASMQFDGCKSGGSGGGLYFYTFYIGQITINQMSFSDCNSTDSGGGAYSLLGYGAQMTITGKMSFYDCHYQETERGYGGGQFLEARIQQSLINVTGELEYNKCEAYNQGGGLHIVVQGNSTIEINKASFTDCLSNQDGGCIALLVYTGSQFTIYGTVSIMNCNSSRYGGGIYLEINNGIVSLNPTEQILIENCTCDGSGCGIYCSITNKGKIQVNNTKFKNCNSERNGGGIYATIQAEGQLILDNLCELSQCKSNGNGGGIYATVDFTTQCTFIIKYAFIHDCKALNNTSLSYPDSGFGGGIFLGGSKK
ncbi:MAG: hypothetical protein EZS28_037498, partial [Streblomastix strix]